MGTICVRGWNSLFKNSNLTNPVTEKWRALREGMCCLFSPYFHTLAYPPNYSTHVLTLFQQLPFLIIVTNCTFSFQENLKKNFNSKNKKKTKLAWTSIAAALLLSSLQLLLPASQLLRPSLEFLLLAEQLIVHRWLRPRRGQARGALQLGLLSGEKSWRLWEQNLGINSKMIEILYRLLIISLWKECRNMIVFCRVCRFLEMSSVKT